MSSGGGICFYVLERGEFLFMHVKGEVIICFYGQIPPPLTSIKRLLSLIVATGNGCTTHRQVYGIT